MNTETQNPKINPNTQGSGLPVDTDVLFSNHKNVYKPRIEKRQRQLLGKLSFLKAFLTEDERMLQVTTGCSPLSIIEQFLTGWIVFYLNRSLFVFTNKRIFHIPTKQNFAYRNSIAQILYGDCQSLAVKGRTLVAQYKNGKTEKFVYIAGHERKKIATLLKEGPLQAEHSPAAERTHLCPRCTGPLIREQYTCGNCSLAFKNKKDAKRISIIYPGGGYFYTRHLFLGMGDALVEVYLSVFVIAALLDVISAVRGSLFAFVLLSLILAAEKALTVYHSNHFVKEFVPKDGRVQVRDQQPVSVKGSEGFEKSDAEAILSVR